MKICSFEWAPDDSEKHDINHALQIGQAERAKKLIENADEVRFDHDPPNRKSQAGGQIDPELEAQIIAKNIQRIQELNEYHAAVMVGGKFLIINEFIDPLTDKPDFSLSSIFDFKNRYANQKLQNPQNPASLIPLAKEWIESPLRREYDGIIFDPNNENPRYYNLWKGLAIEPHKGDWSLFEAHIYEIIASRNPKIFMWVLAWLARTVQDPGGQRPGTAIVLRGNQGTGKGIFVNTFGKIFGKHFLQIAQASQITGRFNHHLKDAIVVYPDEGFWAGDKQAEGVIKNIITEPFITIEQKGKDIIKVKNHVNLIISSNNSWVIPAGLEERRFFVLDVSDERQQDHAYFRAIIDQMENGGLEAFLYDLLEMDISKYNLREFEQTAGLLEQKLFSMDTVQKYWFERLKDGNLLSYPSEQINQYGDTGPVGWEREISNSDQHKDYQEFARALNDRYPHHLVAFGMALKKICPSFRNIRRRVHGGGRAYFRQYPPLAECRQDFERLIKMKIDWEEGEDA